MRWIPSALFFVLCASTAWAGDLIPTDRRFGPLRVASHKVDVSVDNQIAMTRVEQVFANDHAVQLEAHYVFPVPKAGSIIDFSMTVNGKLMRGELLEKNRARQIYEGIVRQSKDPGLLEHVGSNIFRVRVFPILPHSQQKIELTYLERVTYDAGTCRFTYPLLVPGGAKSTKADEFGFRWRLKSRVPIQDVACPTHRANIVRRTEEEADVVFEGRQVDLSRDLEVTYRIARAASGMDLVTHRPKDGDGTFMLLLTPQADAPRLPKDMTFVFDTSGSMEGKRIKQAKAALQFCLSKLQPDDRFNILSFSGDVVAFEKTPVAATEAAKERASQFVRAIDASGATNINAALLRALEHKAPPGRPHLVLFLTDGHPTAGETSAPAIVRNVLSAGANVRVFCFGVGDELNKGLLEDLSEATHAVTEFVAETEDIEEKVSRLQKKVVSPVISDLEIDWGQAEVSAVYPRSTGDLFAGTQLTVLGRYAKAGTYEVTLKGRAGDRPVEIKQKLTFPERIDVVPALPYVWAMRKVAGILDGIRRSGENTEVVTEIIALAKEYRIATPYTSFLVLETEQAYDQHGIDRKGKAFQPPTPTASAPPMPRMVAGGGQSVRREVPKDIPADAPLDEPAIFFPEAKESDHNESADNEDYKQMKGDGKFLGYQRGDSGRSPGLSPSSVYSTMGVGSGAGGAGRYGGRLGGRENLVARGGGTRATESAALSSLKWLVRHQNADGSWGSKSSDPCLKDGPGGNETGLTALSLLAFLGAGYTHNHRDDFFDPGPPGKMYRYGEAVKKALQWLITHQDPEGCVGERGPKYMYDHALASLALSEAYGMSGAQLLKDPAQKAIDFLVAAQNAGKGWRYAAQSGESDTSVTGWAVMALKSAEISGLTFPRSACDGALAWIASVTDEKSFEVGYQSMGTATEPHPTMSAIGVLSRIFIAKRRTDSALGAVHLIVKDLPEAKDPKADYYYWYFGSMALFQYDGPDGPMWKKWNEPMKNALVPAQKTAKDGCLSGSWDPIDRWGAEGGRVYATAINTLTLEVYYRYANVFGGTK